MPEHERMEVVGGASIPLGGFPLNLSYPLARLVVEARGISVVIRSQIIGRVLRPLVVDPTFVEGRLGWTVAWGALDRVVVGPKSMVLHAVGVHDRGCRFVSFIPRKLNPVVELIETRGIPVERVASTVSRVFKVS